MRVSKAAVWPILRNDRVRKILPFERTMMLAIAIVATTYTRVSRTVTAPGGAPP
jgi:hypothetical protein